MASWDKMSSCAQWREERGDVRGAALALTLLIYERRSNLQGFPHIRSSYPPRPKSQNLILRVYCGAPSLAPFALGSICY
jgi:hypothetical protein